MDISEAMQIVRDGTGYVTGATHSEVTCVLATEVDRQQAEIERLRAHHKCAVDNWTLEAQRVKELEDEAHEARATIERLWAEVEQLDNAMAAAELAGDELGSQLWELAKSERECRRLLRELILASECFISSEIVDETTGTIPLMDRLEKAIRAAKAGGDDE